MEINPIDTAQMIGEVTKEHPLNAFMMFVIVALISAVVGLYRRLIKQGDDQTKNLIDSTAALNNSTSALLSLQKQGERTEQLLQRILELIMSGKVG